jgi:hypothetical protein
VLTDVETFDLFLLGDADAAEEAADHRPCNPAGHDRPDGVGRTTQCLDSELAEATAIERPMPAAIAMDVNTPKTDHQGSPDATHTVDGEGTDRIINACCIQGRNGEDNNDAAD